VPAKLRQTSEDATITRSYLSFEMSTWAQGSALTNPMAGDPYEEGARQLLEAATRRMDKLITTEAVSAGIYEKDVFSATVPRGLDWDLVVDACRDGWGDEQEDKAVMLVHSTTEADLLKLKDSTGRPLLLESQTAEGTVRKMAGMEVVVSDRLPLTNSLMGAVTSSGTSPPVATLAGTPLGAVGRDDDLDVVAGEELDVVDREDVRRVGRREDQRRARAVHRDHRVLLRDLFGDQLDHRGVDVELVQVDVRDAVLLRDEGGELLLLKEPELGDLRTEARPTLLRFFARLPELLGREQVLADQEFADALVQLPRLPGARANSAETTRPSAPLLRLRESPANPLGYRPAAGRALCRLRPRVSAGL
jgi:hypothetical protein